MVVGPAIAEEVLVYEEPRVAYIPEVISPVPVYPRPVEFVQAAPVVRGGREILLPPQSPPTAWMPQYVNPSVYYTPNYPYTIPSQPKDTKQPNQSQ